MKFTTILLSILFTVSAYAQPKFEFIGGGVKDWGKVMKQEGPLHTTIKIKNTGSKLLEIYGVKPGCGCTTAPIDKRLLDPGEVATVDVTLKIEKDNGPIAKGIEFTTNDPVNDRISYMLKANVKVPIELFPKFLNMGAVEVNEATNRKVVISNHTSSSIKIIDIIEPGGDIKINFKKGTVLKPGSHTPIEAIIKTSKKGMFDKKVILRTNSKENPEIVIPIRGIVGKTEN
ncbi:MAG: DUF1573 domain-containing protein [Chlorobiota bacterium]